MAREIALTQGNVAVVDDEDYEMLAQKKWYCSYNGYAVRSVKIASGKKRTVMMHRAILDASSGLCVDHINHDKLDNRRANLRLCSTAENCRNARKHTATTSRFKGVHWYKAYAKWRAMIMVDRRPIHIGYFDDEDEAARAYNAAAAERFGEFALPNVMK